MKAIRIKTVIYLAVLAIFTFADGLVSFEINADGPGEITVTVTKHNYVPYQGTITVTE